MTERTQATASRYIVDRQSSRQTVAWWMYGCCCWSPMDGVAVSITKGKAMAAQLLLLVSPGRRAVTCTATISLTKGKAMVALPALPPALLLLRIYPPGWCCCRGHGRQRSHDPAPPLHQWPQRGSWAAAQQPGEGGGGGGDSSSSSRRRQQQQRAGSRNTE